MSPLYKQLDGTHIIVEMIIHPIAGELPYTTFCGIRWTKIEDFTPQGLRQAGVSVDTLIKKPLMDHEQYCTKCMEHPDFPLLMLATT